MKPILSKILTSVFFILALLHFYWATGGQYGFKSVLPTTEKGISVLSPTTFDSIVVGIILLSFGCFYLFSLRVFKNRILVFFQNIGLWFVPIIFTLRAVGDFKYIGLFKQIKSTKFANLDTFLFSPLCFTIAFIGFALIKIKDSKKS